MKNRDIERELRASVTPDKNRIWNKIEQEVFPAAVQTQQVMATNAGNVKTVSFRKKVGLFTSLAAVLALFIAATFLLPQFLQGNVYDFSGSFYMDINPSVQVSVDKKGNVTEVVPLNEDALVLLQDTQKSDFMGKTGAQVATCIWELAYETGYITPTQTNNAVLITGALNDENLNESYSKSVTDGLKTKVKQAGVLCAVLSDKLDETLKDDAQKFNVSTSKYQRIMLAKESGAQIAEEEYENISMAEINKRVNEVGKKYQQFCGDSYKEFDGITQEVNDSLTQLKQGTEYALSLLSQNGWGQEKAVLSQTLVWIENGAKAPYRELFDRLSSVADMLCKEWQEEATLAAWRALVDEIAGKCNALQQNVEQAKNNVKNKHEQYRNEAKDHVENHRPSDNFEDDYEEWLEDVYDDYRDNWSDHKNQWQRPNYKK